MRGIAGSDERAFWHPLAVFPNRLELGQTFSGGIRTAAFILKQSDSFAAGDIALFVKQLLLGGQRHDFIGKQACLLCFGCALLTLQSVSILRFTGDAVALAHNFGRLNHLNVSRGHDIQNRLGLRAVAVFVFVLNQ